MIASQAWFMWAAVHLSVAPSATAPAPAPTTAEAPAAAAPATAPDAANTPQAAPAEGSAPAPQPAAANAEGVIAPVELGPPVQAPPTNAGAPEAAPAGPATVTTPQTVAPTMPLVVAPPPSVFVPSATDLRVSRRKARRASLEPHEVRWRLDLGLGGGIDFSVDESYDALLGSSTSGNRRGRVDADVGVSFPVGDKGLFVGAVAGYRGFEAISPSWRGQSFGTSRLREALFGVRVGYAIVDGVEPYGVLGGGPSFWRSSEDSEEYGVGLGAPSSVDVQLRDATKGFVQARAGLQLYLPRKWLMRRQASRVTAGLDLGVGYNWRPEIEAQVVETSPNEDNISINTPSLGTFRPGAVVWNAGLFLRVM